MSKAAELANLIGNINAGGGSTNRNVIINGAMNVAQRGTSFPSVGASATQYTLDRFMWQTGNSAGRLTATQDSSAPEGFANSLKFACTTADTSIVAGEYGILQQPIEGQNLQHFSKGTSDAKPFAVSFYVKGNASATYVCELYDSTNARQISKTFNVTTSWSRVELSFPPDTSGTLNDDNAESMILGIWLHAGSNYSSGTLNSSAWASNTNANRTVGISSFFDSTDRTFFITGVQVEVGQNPTDFEHEPLERTLLKCRRYFIKKETGVNFGTLGVGGHIIGGTTAAILVPLPVEMRSQGTLTSGGSLRLTAPNADSVTVALAYGSTHIPQLTATDSGGFTDGGGNGVVLMGDNDDDAFIAFDAEL